MKNVLGDYFVTNIKDQTYVFKLDGSRINTTKQKGAFAFQTIDYTTDHYLPIDHSNLKEMEIIIEKNSFPKVNQKLMKIFTTLSKREKNAEGETLPDELIHHNVGALVEELQKHPEKYMRQTADLLKYFETLKHSGKIVTPLRRVSEMLDKDIKTPDPKFFGMVMKKAREADKIHQKIVNPVATAKKSYLVMILIMMIVVLVIVSLYLANAAGVFDNMMGGIGGMIPGGGGGAGYTQQELMAKYPNGPALRAAVDSGKLDYNKLPKDVKKIVDDTPPVVSKPIP